MRELAIQALLRRNGLEKVKEDLKLVVKQSEDGRVLLKYKQIEADWTIPELHQCRGIILDSKDNWNVVSYGYDKFFNHGEVWMKELDLESLRWFTKEDGSLIVLYNYKGDWYVQTSGSIDAKTVKIGLNDSSFYTMFEYAIKDQYGMTFDEFVADLDPKINYIFELNTPENIVVVQHKDYRVILHGARDLRTLNEIDVFTDSRFERFTKVKIHLFDSVDDVKKVCETLHWSQEGYVGVDKFFNRCKIKGKAYVDRHYSSTAVSKYAIIGVIRANELDEFFVYFNSKQEGIRKMEANYKALIEMLDAERLIILNEISGLERKEAALFLINKYKNNSFLKAFAFEVMNRNKSGLEFLNHFNDKEIYHMISKDISEQDLITDLWNNDLKKTN